MQDKTLLERPINDIDEDLFNIGSYVADLEKAINDGAKFIAIDGEFGSGKSSLVNMLKEREKNKSKKTTFVNVNFLNINEKEISSENSINNTINNYHRYFVNQVANDICSNPFEIEQLFYHSYISYAVTNPSKYKLWRIIVDKLLLILTSYMIIFITYKTFLQSIEELNFIFQYSNKINPIVLMMMFVFVIIYGYGIYKPNKQEYSPMLDIDKCRNIFYKIVSTKIKRSIIFKRKEKTKLFLIIDDLDRIDIDLQIEIISLLYNEYYPLKIDGVELIFVFMLNTHKIQNKLSNNNLSNDKLFDYILPVSNNQKHIIRHLINKLINEHKTLNKIFNNAEINNKKYLINQICKKYGTIRKLKHFFNKLISKYNYLKSKNIENINYDEMIIITLLSDEIETSKLDQAIAQTINNEQISEDAKNIKSILKECNIKKMFDIDYYIYLYNFINKDDLLTHHEIELYYISEKGYDYIDENDEKKILDYLENEKVRYDKIFYEVFCVLDDKTKLVFMSSKKFCDYLLKTNNFLHNIKIKNAYRNRFGYHLCDNIPLTKDIKENIIFDLNKSLELYLSSKTTTNMSSLRNEFVCFLENMNYRIINFELKEYFSVIDIDDKIYELLFKNFIYKNMKIGFYLFSKNIINCNYIKKYIDVEFIQNLNLISSDVATIIKNQILNSSSISFEVLLNIIANENYKCENIDLVLDKMNCFEKNIEFNELKIILNNYDYNIKLDKHILHSLIVNEEETINYINKKQYMLSTTILNKLNSISSVYQYTNFYENIFLSNEYYNLYIVSRILKNKKFDLKENLIINAKYVNSLLNNYKDVKDWAKNFEFSKKYTDLILNKFDFNKMDFFRENFWKILNLIPNVEKLGSLSSILTMLNSKNKLEEFIDYCTKENTKKIDIKFIKYLRAYAEEHNMTKQIKNKLTRTLKKFS